jgi:two-component sensor histidine kinase
MDIGTLLVLNSFILFTKSYLQTKITLPYWHKVLTIATWVLNCVLIPIDVLQMIGWLPIIDAITLIINIVTALVLALLLLVAIIGVRKKIVQAKYYLLAQALPLLLMLVLAIWMFTNSNQGWVLQNLPNLAILAQTITFAIALVARVNKLKDDLHFNQILSEQTQSKLLVEQQTIQRLHDKVEHDKKEVAAAQQIKLLMKELHHRVKNNLQIVSSLLSLQSFRIKDKAAADAVKEGQHRIEAMSLIHQRLYTTDNITEVNIKEYITDLSESLMQAYGYNKNEFDLVLTITDELMNVDKAIPLSLIINELVTNAFKYAFTKETKPQLTVALNHNNGMMELLIQDNGKGIDMQVWQSKSGSYGKELVHTFTKQINGIINMDNQNGTKFTIQFPL